MKILYLSLIGSISLQKYETQGQLILPNWKEIYDWSEQYGTEDQGANESQEREDFDDYATTRPNNNPIET